MPSQEKEVAESADDIHDALTAERAKRDPENEQGANYEVFRRRAKIESQSEMARTEGEGRQRSPESHQSFIGLYNRRPTVILRIETKETGGRKG